MLNKVLLFAEASLILLWAQTVLRLKPFRGADPRVRGRRPRLPCSPHPTRIARAITIAARFIPGSTCLVRAMAAQRLLAYHGHPSNLHIGVANVAASGFEAHAWIEHNGVVLLGRTATEYTHLLKWSVAP